MSTRLLFEGPDIEGVLARVRDEHGAQARIVQADKVRSGGIAGFFVRERYAVTVEVGDAVEPIGAPDEAPAAPTAPSPAARTEPSPDPAARPVDAPGTLLELAAAMDAAEAADAQVVLSTAGIRRAAQPALSTTTPQFAAVLAGMARTTGPAAPFVPATPASVQACAAPGAGELARRLLALGVPPQIVSRVEDGAGADLHARLVRALAALPQDPAARLQGGDVLMIAGAGAAAYDVAGAVSRRLRLDPTRVLLAAASALGTGVNPARRLSGPSEARRRAAKLQRCDVPTVVAVDAPCDGESGEWAREVADALGARTVWALVDATSKPADLSDHLTSMGRLDGLAVRATGASRDPASALRPALDLGLPTVWLEGRPGSPSAWASLLVERLGESR